MSDLLYGKKWAACGDSFTNGDFKGLQTETPVFTEGPFAGQYRTYDRLIADRCSMKLQHLAAGGMTIATPTDAVFTNTFTSGLYKQIDPDTDYITLYFGINDSHHRPKSSADDGEIKKGIIHLGTIDDTKTDTFFGAWNVVMEYLITHYPLAHIGLIISNGCETNDYPEAEIAIARKWGVPYINLNGDERTPCMGRSTNPGILQNVRDFRTRMFAVAPPVNTHPNERAHAYESVFIENWLRSI
ncbi:MAG: SGNH/GDSL hydrolase family protein [Firmicutes bacterium]|nr:SGNH/GDSL hydrolase family protein [Bacillota bacterium]